MRRNDNTESLKEVISRFLELYKLEGKFSEVSIINSWEKVLGPVIAKRTQRIFIKNRTLFVQVNSAPLKHELNMGKSKIVDMLNDHINKKVIDDLVLL